MGAAVFDAVSGRLVAVGVNRVVSQNCSVAHAEMMAIMIAQQRLSRSRMNEDDGHYVLATSSQPCCQCYGAMVWAGIDELLIGARADDVEELTEFDEGPLPAEPSLPEMLQRHLADGLEEAAKFQDRLTAAMPAAAVAAAGSDSVRGVGTSRAEFPAEPRLRPRARSRRRRVQR